MLMLELESDERELGRRLKINVREKIACK